MFVTFLVGILSVLLAWFSGALNNKKYLIASFVVLFIYLALRYDFGNDYMTYYDLFDDIKATSWDELMLLANINEFGETMEFAYIYLNKIFSLFSNFFFFIAFHSLLLCLVYYSIVKRYVNPRYYWLALLILIFHTSLMVRSMSGLRQGLAVFCFIYSFQYLIEKRSFWKYAICVLAASLFHYSAIILLPLYFFFNQSKVKKIEPFIYLFVYIFVIFFGESLLKPIENITTLFFPKYTYYVDNEAGMQLGSGFGLLLASFLYVFILFFAKKDTPANIVSYRIAAIFIILSPVSLIIVNLSRLTLYFAPALVVIIPQLMTDNKKVILRNMFLIIYIFFTVYSFYGYVTSPIFVDTHYYYKIILSK